MHVVGEFNLVHDDPLRCLASTFSMGSMRSRKELVGRTK